MFKQLYSYLKSLNASLQSIIFVSTVLILFLIIVFLSLGIVQQRYHITELEKEVFEANNENKILVEKIEKTSTVRYIEEIAREKLGMVRSEEVPVQVNEVNSKSTEKEEKVLDSKEKAGIYLKEWYNQLGEWFESSKKKR